jgi:hypothetical protein
LKLDKYVLPLRTAATSAAPFAPAPTPTFTARGLWTRNIYVQRAAIHLRPIHLRDRILRFGLVSHFHERKSAGLAGRSVGNDLHTLYVAELADRRMKIVLRRLITEIPHKDVNHCFSPVWDL